MFVFVIIYFNICSCLYCMAKQQQSSSRTSGNSSFWGNWLYCPASNNPSELSFPATLFLHRKRWYYVKLRVALRHDTTNRLIHYLQQGDVFSYAGGFIKIAAKNTVDIYDVLDKKEPIGSVVYRSKARKKNI